MQLFRSELRPLGGRETEEEFLRLLTLLGAQNWKSDPLFLDEVLAYNAEPLLLLAVSYVFREFDREKEGKLRESLALRLIRHAEEEADREGVCWTPLLEALERAMEEMERRRFTRDYLPPLAPRLEALRPWVRERTRVEELYPLLRFRALPVQQLLATESLLWDSKLLLALRERTGVDLAKNSALPAELREELFAWAWQSWQRKRDLSFQILKEGARLGDLSETLKRELFEWADRKEPGDTERRFEREVTHEVLFSDPALPRERIEEILRQTREQGTIARALVHPNSPPSLWESWALLEDAYRIPDVQKWAARQALTREHELPFPIPAERLKAILIAAGADEYAVASAIAHPASTEEMRVRALKLYVQRADPSERRTEEICKQLVRRPGAMAHPEVRTFVLSLGSMEVLKSLFPIRDPEFFSETVTALVKERGYLKLVYQALETQEVPTGVSVPPDVLAPLLESGSAAERLLVISHLPQMQGEAAAVPS